MTERKYKHPSVLEAIVELRIAPSSAWGISSFVDFAGLAKDRGYPILKDAAPGFQISLPVSGGKPQVLTSAANRVQTWNESGNQLWQAGPQLFAANRRAPYEGWEKFRPHVAQGLELYLELAKPEKAEALVMQYVNRIVLDDENQDPSQFLVFVPPTISYAERATNFICRAEQAYNTQDSIAVTSTRDQSAPGSTAIILDIVYMSLQPSLESSQLMSLIDSAHLRVTEAYEKSITESLRERMEPV